MRHYIKHIMRVMAMAVCLAFTSCQDDTFGDFYIDGDGDSPDVNFAVDIPPMAVAELSSRGSDGNILKGFDDNSLRIFVYNSDDTKLLYDCGKGDLDDYMMNEEGNNKHPQYPYGEDKSYVTTDGEGATKRATFKLKSFKFIPGETYRIYVTANVSGLTEDDYKTEDALKSKIVVWDPEEISANNQMLGMFSTSDENVDGESITFSSSSTYTLHAWLVRCSSKVTISYNTEQLNDDTWIYLHSVTLHNVPKYCYLGDGNIATAGDYGVYEDGESIIYAEGGNYENAESEFSNWPVLTRGLGKYGSDHSEKAEALFFYENLQGTGKDKAQVVYDEKGNPIKTGDGDTSYPLGVNKPDGWENGSDTKVDNGWRDNKPYGTYIEVLAYYRSTTKGNEGMGKIKYRFMLGMDVERDYNAYRNHHFKLILNFLGNANEVDWHIEYEQDGNNPIYVPHPFYISYLYGEEVQIPITINGELAQGTKVKAEIVENNWKPEGAPSDVYWTGDTYSGGGINYDGPWHGFLSLRPSNALSNHANNNNEVPNSDAIGRENTLSGIARHEKAYLMSYWYGGYENMNSLGVSTDKLYSAADLEANEEMYIPMQGYREYDTTNRNGITKDNTKNNPDEYEILTTTNGGKTRTHLYLPLYTRALFMVKGLGYSGANPHFFYQRKAVVKFTCTVVENGVNKEYSKLCDVIQVRRVINPAGIYRERGNNSSFAVTLSFRTSENSTTFMPFASEGKWSAEIESGDPGFITLNGSQKVYGRTGEYIKFQVHFVPPSSTSSAASKNRYAVILIKYHDYTCKHRIIVRQGYDPDQVIDVNLAGKPAVKWHCFNLRGGEKEAESPLDPGSLFRFGNLDYAIDASNNNADQFGIDPSGYEFTLVGRNGKIAGKSAWYIDDGNHAVLDPNTPNLCFQAINPVNFGNDEVVFNNYFDLYEFDEEGKKGLQTNKDKKTRLAKFEEWRTLREHPSIVYTYGICYDDNSSGTSMTASNAFSYSYANESNAGMGMRGIFLYNSEDGRNFFLPIGTTGYGRRKTSNTSLSGNHDAPGTLRYANRSIFMPSNLVTRMPSFWNIKDNRGAIYWGFPEYGGRTDAWNGDHLDFFNAWDVNYTTYDFNQFGNNAYSSRTSQTSYNDGLQENGNGKYYFSDAAFMRLVDEPD